MACRRYTVTVTTSNRGGSIQYLDCNFSNQTIDLAARQVIRISAETIFSNSSNVRVTEDTDSSTGGGSPTIPTLYYQLVPCNNQNVVVYTTRPFQRANERVTISNPQDVGVPSNVSFTYNGQTTERVNPGVIAVSVFSTGATGCVDTPPPPPTRPNFNPINLGVDSIGSSVACFRFNNRTIPITQYYIDTTSLRTATKITTDSTGLNNVPNGYYTDGEYYIEVRNGIFSPARLCQNIPPPQDDDIDVDVPIEPPSIIYTIRSCSNQNKVWSTNRAPTINRERITLQDITTGGREDFVYFGQPGTTTVGFFVGENEGASTLRYRIIPSGQADCLIEPQEVLPRYYSLKVCFFQEYQRREYENVTLYTNRPPLYEEEQVTITNPKDTKAQYGIEVPANWRWYYEKKEPTLRFGTLAKGVVSTGRVRCQAPGSDNPDPVDDEPKTVNCLFAQVITPSLQSSFSSLCSTSNLDLDSFQAGQIVLDDRIIGIGDATVTLEIGKSYTVEFRKPSHPQFTFTDGAPSRFTFTATKSTTRIESIFTPSFISNVGTLTINTSLNPTLSNVKLPLSIYISGIGKVGENSLINYKLEPGEYTIYFDPIQIEGLIYQTPPKQKVVVRKCQTTTINAVYSGIPLPTYYWLKAIDGSEKMEFNSLITKGMFSNDIPNLVNFYTSSLSNSLNNHYTHIYQDRVNSPTSSIQFSVAYGHVEGSGSNDEGGQYNDTPTRAIYGQYRNIILGSATDKLNLAGSPTKHFYAISYQKDRRDTRADYNALEINIAHLSGSQFIATSDMRYHTGSNVKLGGQGKVLRLISDSKINDEPQRAVPSAPVEYNIVSGSIEDGVYNTSSPHYYGKLYPSLGVVLIDANKLDVSASFGTVTTRETDGKNQLKLFTAISGAALYNDASGDALGMKARATKEEITYYYHINVRNKEFNYSNNPSIYNNERLQLLQYGVPPNVRITKDFFDDTAVLDTNTRLAPKTYITTVGLYDINRNLIAVAKLSKAEFKSFTDEVMFTVKLKF
jgi:hypothetical protein